MLLVAHSLTVLADLMGVIIALFRYMLKEALGSLDVGAALLILHYLMYFVLRLVIPFAVVIFSTNRLSHYFYSAYSLPFRWLARRVRCLGSIFTALAA